MERRLTYASWSPLAREAAERLRLGRQREPVLIEHGQLQDEDALFGLQPTHVSALGGMAGPQPPPSLHEGPRGAVGLGVIVGWLHRDHVRGRSPQRRRLAGPHPRYRRGRLGGHPFADYPGCRWPSLDPPLHPVQHSRRRLTEPGTQCTEADAKLLGQRHDAGLQPLHASLQSVDALPLPCLCGTLARQLQPLQRMHHAAREPARLLRAHRRLVVTPISAAAAMRPRSRSRSSSFRRSRRSASASNHWWPFSRCSSIPACLLARPSPALNRAVRPDRLPPGTGSTLPTTQILTSQTGTLARVAERVARDDVGQPAQAVEAHPLLLLVHPWLRIHTHPLQARYPRPRIATARRNTVPAGERWRWTTSPPSLAGGLHA